MNIFAVGAARQGLASLAIAALLSSWPLAQTRSADTGAQVADSAAAFDEAATTQLVTAAGEACDQLPQPPRSNNIEARLAQQRYLRAWQNLAMARANLEDEAGAVEALNHLNSDPEYSLASAWIMLTEATATARDLPANLDPQVVRLARVNGARVLATSADYAAADEQVAALAETAEGAFPAMQADLAIAKQQFEHKHTTEAFAHILSAAKRLDAVKDAQLRFAALDALLELQLDNATPAEVRAVIALTQNALEDESLERAGIALRPWLRIGYAELRLGDAKAAAKAFAKVKSIYDEFGEPITHVPFGQAPAQVAVYQAQAEALLKRDPKQPPAQLAAILALWDRWLVEGNRREHIKENAELLAYYFRTADEAAALALLEALDDPGLKMQVVHLGRQQTGTFGAKESAPTLIALVRKQFADDESLRPLRISMLSEAVGAATDLGDQALVNELLDEIVVLVDQGNESMLGAVAALASEAHQFERAQKLIARIENPADKAAALADLAHEVTQDRCRKQTAALIAKRHSELSKTGAAAAK